jgi:hypothetical protein
VDTSRDQNSPSSIDENRQETTVSLTAQECAESLISVAKDLQRTALISHYVGNYPISQQKNVQSVLQRHPDQLSGNLLAQGRARRIVTFKTFLRFEEKYVHRQINFYLGYKHTTTFWAWTATGLDIEVLGGALDVEQLSQGFDLASEWGIQGGNVEVLRKIRWSLETHIGSVVASKREQLDLLHNDYIMLRVKNALASRSTT